MSIFRQGHSDGDFSAFRQGQGQQFSLTGRRHNPLTLDKNRGILRRLSSEIGWGGSKQKIHPVTVASN